MADPLAPQLAAIDWLSDEVEPLRVNTCLAQVGCHAVESTGGRRRAQATPLG